MLYGPALAQPAIPSLTPLAQPLPVSPPKKAPLTSHVTLSSRVQLLAWSDPQNQGDVPDQSVLPGGSLKKEWGASLHLNATLGARFVYPDPIAGFSASGHLLTAVQVRRIFSVPSAGFVLDSECRGLKIGVGKFLQPTVSTLSPSSFQFSTNWGNLLHASTGAYAAKSFGRLSAQLGVGRPSLPDFTEALTATAGAAPRLPFVEGRLAFTDPTRTGWVPSGPARGARPGPLTVSVSGAHGWQRAGVGERAAVQMQDPLAAAPRVEDLPSWVASAELLLPLPNRVADLVLSGEAYLGEGANAYTGAVRQRPRVDPRTGAHRALSSRGGWIQLSAQLPTSLGLPGRTTLVAIAGLERVSADDLAAGLSVEGPLAATENRLLAISLAKDLSGGLHLGVQVQQQRTRYLDQPTGEIYAVLAETSLEL